MNRVYSQILEQIEKYDNIVVARHQVPDFDASGTQWGLVTWLKDNYPHKHIYAIGKEHKEFSPKLYPATSQTVDIEGKFLYILVDVAQKHRTDDENKYYEKADFIIIIDHHPRDTEKWGNIYIVKEHAAAAAEIVADILLSFKKIMSKECAYYLYSAIVGDSGRFLYSDTSSKTFKVATRLMKTGFDFQDIYYKMYTKSIEDVKIIKHIFEVVQFSKKNIAYYILDDKTIKSWGISREATKAFVNQFSNYEEIKIWLQITEDVVSEPEFRWAVSIRSRGVEVNKVASMFNGGGHANASGCRLPTLEKVYELIDKLDELL